MNEMVIIGKIALAFVGAIGGTISTWLEVRNHRKGYEIAMKVCWITFGLAGILIGILAALGGFAIAIFVAVLALLWAIWGVD